MYHNTSFYLLIMLTIFCESTEQFTISPKQELKSDKSMVSFVLPTASNLTRNTTKLHKFQHDNASAENPLQQLTNSEARGSTYSYYYISKRVWYIPLWFLIYFCLYILGLIIRSAILHRIKATPTELAPGRYFNIDSPSQVNVDAVTELTSKVLNLIENYQKSTHLRR